MASTFALSVRSLRVTHPVRRLLQWLASGPRRYRERSRRFHETATLFDRLDDAALRELGVRRCERGVSWIDHSEAFRRGDVEYYAFNDSDAAP